MKLVPAHKNCWSNKSRQRTAHLLSMSSIVASVERPISISLMRIVRSCGPPCHLWQWMQRVGPSCCGNGLEQGVTWKTAASDGGGAIADALGSVEAVSRHQRDVWHVLHVGSQVQGRVDRFLDKLQERLPTICRQ